MLDIDNFKKVNDKHGHGVGDEVICFVAERLTQTTKFGDIAGRYGGEEFCLVLPGKTTDEAELIAERLRKQVQDEAETEFPALAKVTISLGIAQLDDEADTTAELLTRADQALYAAKLNGRNRVVKWSEVEIDPWLSAGQNKPNRDSAPAISARS